MAIITRYGIEFDTSAETADGYQKWDNLGIEMGCIRKGPDWLKEQGRTLEFHFENCRKIIWPELDDHRWHRLCLKEILASKISVLMGCASSGKTHEASWIYLLDYWCFPKITCVLVSSTTLPGLRKRVWGEMTMLWEQGVERFPKLGGHLLDSAIAITTDDLEDCEPGERKVRDMRKGIFGVACVAGGKFVGLSRYMGIKQKRMRLIADEACFPAGTLIDTPSGNIPIESVRVGDFVWGATGASCVKNIMKKSSLRFVTVRTRDGRVVKCTPTHPFFTQKGWVCACELNQSHYMVATNEAMSLVSQDVQANIPGFGMPEVPKSPLPMHWSWLQKELLKEYRQPRAEVLRSGLRVEGAFTRPGIPQEVLLHKEGGEDSENSERLFQKEPRGICQDAEEVERWHGEVYEFAYAEAKVGEATGNESNYEVSRPQAHYSWRQWDWKNQGGEGAAKTDPGRSLESCNKDGSEGGKWIPHLLQGGCCDTGTETGNRGRREFSQAFRQEGKGCEKDLIPFGSWVDSVEIHESEDSGAAGNSDGRTPVYNLEIEGHPSYSVNGFLVHNSAMGDSFLSAFSNLNKNEDFKATILGNPADPLDPLGRAAEPKDGWTDDYLEPTKTAVWDTRFMNGRCVNLVGLDSPNFDFPADQPTRYKYLISKEKIDETLSFWPKDSYEYYGQCVGTMKIGTMARRVLTRAMCAKFHAQESAVWKDENRTRVYFVDSSYGGDRCVAGWAEFGECTDGKIRLAFNEPKIIPIRVKTEDGDEPEYQIARFIREDCTREGIDPSSMGHDSTGRGALGTAISSIWGLGTHPIDSGGRPTTRPVSSVIFITDEETGQQRHLRCDEHYDRLVTEFWFSVRYAVEADQIRGLPEEAMDELCSRKWSHVKDKKSVEPKDRPSQNPDKQGMKQRMGKSPDVGDWAAGIVEMARRKGFQIDSLVNQDERKKSVKNWHAEESKKLIEHQLSRQLQPV